MKRVGALLALGAAMTLAAPLAGSAQVINFYFGSSTGDTVIGARPGVEVQLPLRALDYYCGPTYYCYYYTYSGRLTFYYDPAKLEVLGVQPGNWGVIDTSRTTGSFTLAAQGFAYGYDTELLKLRVRLLTGVTDGTYLWARADSAEVYYIYGGVYPVGAASTVGEVCYASNLFGDVDTDLDVDSRDALITLSAAVGLPVTGFSLSLGDVDRDGLTNSRDALMMLSYAIGLSVGGNNRLGQGVPSACAPLASLPEKIVYRRQGTTFPNDTLYLLENGVAVPIPNATGLISHPRLAADGSRVVYNCINIYSYRQTCRINTDGTGLADLTSAFSTFSYNDFPDWSPNGLEVSFRYSGYPYTMSDSGTGQAATGSFGTSYESQVAWSRDGGRLAYSSSGLRTVDSNGTNDVLVTTGFSDVSMIRWSPAGDSLAFTRSGSGDQLWVAPAVGGTAQRVLTPFTLGYSRSFDWGPPGFVFGLTGSGRAGLWYLPSLTSPIQRLTRGADLDPAFRRNP